MYDGRSLRLTCHITAFFPIESAFHMFFTLSLLLLCAIQPVTLTAKSSASAEDHWRQPDGALHPIHSSN